VVEAVARHLHHLNIASKPAREDGLEGWGCPSIRGGAYVVFVVVSHEHLPHLAVKAM